MAQKKLVLVWLALAGLAMAGSMPDTYHQDFRRDFVKLDLVTQQVGKIADLQGEDLARAFLGKNASRYGVHPKLTHFELVDIKKSLLGTHYYFGQFLNGTKVHRAEMIVSISHENGGVYMVYNNSYPVGPHKRFMAAELREDDAIEVAWQDLRVHGKLMDLPQSQLVYMPSEEGFRLVYLVDLAVEAPFGYWEHTIDAVNGEVLDARRSSLDRNEPDAVDFDTYEGPVWDRDTTVNTFAVELAEQSPERSYAKAAANGSATVFDPDPVTTLQNSNLEDNSPASAFSAAYVTRTLQDIDLSGGTYRLTGPYITIMNFESPNTAPSTTTNGNWTATRGNNAFNDAMTYFHIDQNQRYIQSLGFTGSTGIQSGSIETDTDGLNGGDNSHFIPSSNRMAFGHGCVDDNEDAFVILHEYGHAIHRSINSNWFGGDTGGMGEGFGDYWGGSYRYRTPNGASFNPAWAFPWDGHNNCWGGRNMDQTQLQYDPTKSYGAHQTVGGVLADDLWSTPLLQSLITLTGQGVAHGEVDQIILQAHFGLGSGLSMRDMATNIVNTAQSLFPSGPHSGVFRQKFEDQNILAGGGGTPTGSQLNNGDSRANLAGATGSETLFYIDVPAGASNLVVAISGGSGDCDLYTRFGNPPTTGTYDCRPFLAGNNETCTVASPSTGRYHVMLRGYSAFSNVTLTVNYSTGSTNQAPTAAFSASVSNLAVNFTDSSSDSDGNIASYAWNFGDGSTATSANPNHTYATAGTYNVTLTVTDNDGATDSTSQSVTVTAGSGGSWTTLSSTDFESGWGPFSDGGSDCRRSINDSSFAHQGSYCVRLRDNSGAASAFASTNNVNLSSYSEVRIQFWYRPVSMETGENFFVECFNGSSWVVVADFVRGTDFNNGSFYNPTVTFDTSSVNFTTNNKFRFRCDASANGDRIYIDEVVISAR